MAFLIKLRIYTSLEFKSIPNLSSLEFPIKTPYLYLF